MLCGSHESYRNHESYFTFANSSHLFVPISQRESFVSRKKHVNARVVDLAMTALPANKFTTMIGFEMMTMTNWSRDHNVVSIEIPSAKHSIYIEISICTTIGQPSRVGFCSSHQSTKKRKRTTYRRNSVNTVTSKIYT